MASKPVSFWGSNGTPDNAIQQGHRGSTDNRFISITRDIAVPPSPTGYIFTAVQTETDIENIRQFLRQWFGRPPNSPRLDNPICERDQILLSVRYKINGGLHIAGTVRYKYTGNFNGHPINIIDCFCIHPEWRKRGIGTYLLSALHHYTNSVGRKWSIFLKEGRVLPITQTPFYSSLYKYRRICSDIFITNVQTIGVEVALKIIGVFKLLRPDVFIITNNQTLNQKWRLYSVGKYWILAVIQDTYQIHPYNYGKIGFCAGVIESIGFPQSLRKDALLQITEVSEFSWMWVDTMWIDDISHGSIWNIDGPFHWYAYQWTTSIKPSRDYCIMI